ncbi:MAG: nucleotide sugar dehydrogenase [Schleiferiaceae bacterium]|nr:nucleotide sugar dehydrogenase [Schleiferiaceae bacterium]
MHTLPTDISIAVIGMGYVGLPLALAFSKHQAVVGFDINRDRVKELNAGKDSTKEADPKELQAALNGNLSVTADKQDLAKTNVYIVTVPTPINDLKAPDLGPLKNASQMIGQFLNPGDVVIYESTTYPGCTEDDCVPILESESQLTFNSDFFCGYSPERINPGDKVNTLASIVKVTSGSTPEAAIFVDELYQTIITAGTHLAPSMKVAEASKAIENAQRDVNISFVNELALIFDRVGIDTRDVLAAASTKWNFLPYSPGLVGGHCISVDPYYLAHKAKSLGYHPAVILSGRRVNDSMGLFVASKVVKLIIDKGGAVKNSKALILGITFKENCPDIRNTKVIDIRKELIAFGLDVDCYDPWANSDEVQHELGFPLTETLEPKGYDAIILAVSHDQFLTLKMDDLKSSQSAVVFDAKGLLPRESVDARL